MIEVHMKMQLSIGRTERLETLMSPGLIYRSKEDCRVNFL